jgi:DNA-directed RNA polymerase specialized sigma subunit
VSELALVRAAQAGDRGAEDRLLRDYLERVEAIAKRYQTARAPAEDLAQDGLLELSKAIERFDPNGGAQLWTYARYSIERAIKRSAQGASVIKLPVRVAALIPKVNATRNTLRERLDRDPTLAEVGEELGLTEAEVVEIEREALGMLLLEEEGRMFDREDPFEGLELAAADSGAEPFGTAEVKALLRAYPVLLSKLLGSRDETLEGSAARAGRPGSWLHLRLLDLAAALKHMPRNLFAVVELVGIQDMRAADAASRLGTSERTVYSRYREGLEWLARHLNEPDRDPAVWGFIALPQTMGRDPLAECVHRYRHVFEAIAVLDRGGQSDLSVKWIATQDSSVAVLAGDLDGDLSRPLLRVLGEIPIPPTYTT